MRTQWAFLPVVLLAASSVAAQQVMPPSLPTATNVHESTPTIYYAGPEVTPPELSSPAVSVSLPKNCNRLDGIVRLSGVVDATGTLRDMKLLRADDPRLGDFASGFVLAARITPATHNGVSVSVAVEVTVGLQTCVPTAKEIEKGENKLILRAHPFIVLGLAPAPSAQLESSAVTDGPKAPLASGKTDKPYEVGGAISAPIPIFQPDLKITNYAKRNRIRGDCVIGAIIDADGIPQDLHVVKSLEPGLDRDSVETLKTWRFKPALKDGKTPVAAEVTLVVSINVYGGYFAPFVNLLPKPPNEVLASAKAVADHSVTAPVILNGDEVMPDYPPYARMNQISGVCVVGLFVGTDGVPQDVHVIKSLDPNVDEDVVDAVKRLRFKPALKDGTTPVGVNLVIPYNLKLRHKWTLF